MLLTFKRFLILVLISGVPLLTYSYFKIDVRSTTLLSKDVSAKIPLTNVSNVVPLEITAEILPSNTTTAIAMFTHECFKYANRSSVTTLFFSGRSWIQGLLESDSDCYCNTTCSLIYTSKEKADALLVVDEDPDKVSLLKSRDDQFVGHFTMEPYTIPLSYGIYDMYVNFRQDADVQITQVSSCNSDSNLSSYTKGEYKQYNETVPRKDKELISAVFSNCVAWRQDRIKEIAQCIFLFLRKGFLLFF